MRMYVQLDVDWPENRKRIRAGLEGAGLHAICLCLAKRSSRDGWVARDTLTLYGATDDLIDRLVSLEMLDADGEWVRPHDWLEVNLSSERIRTEKADKARAANHARWNHPGAFESCPKCHKPRSSEPDPDGVQAESKRIPGDPSKAAGSEPEPEQQPQTTDPDGRRALLEAAAEIIGQRAGARPTSSNPAAVAAAVARGVIRDRYQDAYRAIAENPSITADELAEHLEPTHQPHPLDGQAAASRATAERNLRVMRGDACPACDDVGLVLGDDGFAAECECRAKEPA